jgi:hypothetical protein
MFLPPIDQWRYCAIRAPIAISIWRRAMREIGGVSASPCGAGSAAALNSYRNYGTWKSRLVGLRVLADIAGKAFVQGIVLYLGPSQVAFGPGLTACPIDALWS